MLKKSLEGITSSMMLGALRKVPHLIRRQAVAKRLSGHERLHLACGKNVLRKWANIDFESADNVIGWDLTKGLPVRSDSIEFVFCEHFIEHITRDEARDLLSECHRCLRAGGVLRLSTPNLVVLVQEYLAGRVTKWSNVGWNPATPCRMMNDGFRKWGHQFVYDEPELLLVLKEAGFGEIRPVAWRKSTISALTQLECRPYHGEIIVEATKQD